MNFSSKGQHPCPITPNRSCRVISGRPIQGTALYGGFLNLEEDQSAPPSDGAIWHEHITERPFQVVSLGCYARDPSDPLFLRVPHLTLPQWQARLLCSPPHRRGRAFSPVSPVQMHQRSEDKPRGSWFQCRASKGHYDRRTKYHRRIRISRCSKGCHHLLRPGKARNTCEDD
jgi:hypothetical protein